MTEWHIAQMNVGTLRYDADDPRVAEFMNRLGEVNAIADQSPGFHWRLQSDSGNATDIQTGDDPRFIINMSVWESAEALFEFVYKSGHRLVMAKRREWFERPVDSYLVLWWVPSGTTPTPAEGLARLRHLETHGPTPHAFTFKEKFPPPSIEGPSEDMAPEPYCVGWR